MRQSSRSLILFVLLAATAINLLFTIPNVISAVGDFRRTRGFSNPDRRLMQRGNWYRAVLDADRQMPPFAPVRVVSPAPLWYLAYYFYPRLLRRGSSSLEDLPGVREQFAGDWVLAYSEEGRAEMTVYPPLHPGAS